MEALNHPWSASQKEVDTRWTQIATTWGCWSLPVKRSKHRPAKSRGQFLWEGMSTIVGVIACKDYIWSTTYYKNVEPSSYLFDASKTMGAWPINTRRRQRFYEAYCRLSFSGGCIDVWNMWLLTTHEWTIHNLWTSAYQVKWHWWHAMAFPCLPWDRWLIRSVLRRIDMDR